MMSDILPYVLSVLSIYSTFLAANKDKNAWLLKIATQATWITWIITSHNWGFLPMGIIMCGMHIRNYLKWKYDENNIITTQTAC